MNKEDDMTVTSVVGMLIGVLVGALLVYFEIGVI
jgi:hypothetical protein